MFILFLVEILCVVVVGWIPAEFERLTSSKPFRNLFHEVVWDAVKVVLSENTVGKASE